LVWDADGLPEGGIYPCSVGTSVAARKKRKYQRCEWEFGKPCKATTPVDVVGTWMREAGGGI
jgi:hypothetical protein